MRFFFLTLLLISPVFAAEVVTITTSKLSTDFSFAVTEDALLQTLDKTSGCKPRYSLSVVRENYLSNACKAQFIKTLLDSGYKPLDQNGMIFSK